MSERELTPDEEAEISRLLADAAPPVSMPVELTARLDDVLAGLVAEREAEAPIIPLRPRRWPQLLVAAAAVSLVGFVGANFLQQQDMGAGFATAERDTSSDGLAAGGEEAPEMAPSTPRLDSDGTVVSPAWEAAARLAGVDELSAALNRSATKVLGGTMFYAGDSAQCGRPRQQLADAYEVTLSKSRRAVVTVQRVNANAARVLVYPCRQSIVPVSSSLVLGIR